MIRLTISLEDGTTYSKRVHEGTVRKIIKKLRPTTKSSGNQKKKARRRS